MPENFTKQTQFYAEKNNKGFIVVIMNLDRVDFMNNLFTR